MTKRICLFSFLITTSLFSVEIPTAHAQEKKFGKSVELNAQIIQLSNASQSVTSLVSGHLEKYFVDPGQKVKAGQKIALIESILVSKMTADYIALNKQYKALDENYISTKKLYDSGMTSMRELNNQSIQKNAMLAQINALKSQLNTLNIDTKNLKQATANFILYAHNGGTVSQLLQPLHTVLRVDEAVINIIKDQAFYIKSFVPLQYAGTVKVGQKMVIQYNNRDIITHIKQVLPTVDETTQRIVVLSSVDEKADDLYINSFVKSTLYFKADAPHVAVEKSALSFFNNEWVVFVPKKPEEVKGEEHEEHVEVPYEARVVEIIARDDKYVGVLGLEKDEEYVSDKSYYVKSMMLKSSLGEHGH
ncbi:MAG: efflux RND transporter periplasmic adaptor subunit [Sulfurimonas sp.]|nr:efflux RND transporter periplasmic adaptor subunit [Sulfurimonas sp.]